MNRAHAMAIVGAILEAGDRAAVGEAGARALAAPGQYVQRAERFLTAAGESPAQDDVVAHLRRMTRAVDWLLGVVTEHHAVHHIRESARDITGDCPACQAKHAVGPVLDTLRKDLEAAKVVARG